jgi:hypothetical protein
VYITVGGIGNLISWFDSSATEKMLCLFVPKDPEDEVLLGRLFDSRGLISPRLGESLAFCLFSSRATLDNVVSRIDRDLPWNEYMTPKPDHYLPIPGLVKADLGRHRIEYREGRHRKGYTDECWEPIDPVTVDAVPQHVRPDILLQSEAITDNIVRYFDLESSDPPCLIFVSRNDKTPFVVPTAGITDLKIVLSLFDDINRIMELIDSSDLLELSAAVARQKYLTKQKEKLLARFDEHDQEVRAALAAAADAATAYGLKDTILGISPHDSRLIFDKLGLVRNRRLDIAQETRSAAEKAILDSDIQSAFRTIKKAGEKRRNVEADLEKVQLELGKLAQQLENQPIEARCKSVEDLVEEVCEKYKSKFRRSRRSMTLRKWIRALTGAAKVVESLTKPASTIDDVAKAIF